jgi:hypothetical protein
VSPGVVDMSSSIDLTAMVQHAMLDLIDMHHLKLIAISENEVGLLAQTYVIKLFADKEGIHMIYFDKISLLTKGYNVTLFIINKRRDLLEFSIDEPNYIKRKDYIKHQLSVLAQHLDSAGQDILRGSKDWIDEYSWPTVRPDYVISKLLLM